MDQGLHVLRPRTASQSPLLRNKAESVTITPPASLVSRRCWRLWLLRLLLLAGATYVALLVCWNASQLQVRGLSSSESDSVDLLVAAPPVEVQLSAREVSIRVALAVARQQEAEMRAKTTPTDKKEKKKVDARLRCRGWKATHDCDSDGERLPGLDLPCGKPVPFNQSGYCELEDKDTGQVYHAVRRGCNSVREDARFRCLDAAEFVKFPIRAKEVANKALSLAPLPGRGQDGIVMVVYPRLLASAYATVRTLREVLGCQLPIELWYRPDEMISMRNGLEPLKTLADSAGGVTFHEITDARAFGYGTKVYAIHHSSFERVLFLDADNVPVRDPSFLFQSEEFVETGAVFWPDFWHPDNTIFNIHRQSLVWQLLDLPFQDSFEQESGQLLIDRRRHTVPMEVLSFYAFHRPNLFDKFKLAHGDKDLFRFAWLHQNASFHMIHAPPAVAGRLTGVRTQQVEDVRTEAQAQAKETLEAEASTVETPDEYPDEMIWTHLLSFNSSAPRADYVIETYNADPQFPKEQHCYGQLHIGSNPNFYAEEIAGLSFAGLETDLRRFAKEAAELAAHAQNAQARVGLLKGADGSSAASTFRSAMNAVAREANQFQLMRMEFLTGSLNDQDEPRDEVATVEQPKQQIEEKSNSKSSIEEAEEHARSVKMLPANDSKKRRLKCIG
ncbi:hypothetical protein PF011_g5356 [Phytophthora fragariae]|uniref:Nucleotide-diphospho-sugar transferase domain-containing protein n=1 Tax=Phytophthora fragariae TaxID=53985 RepID=A0A6A3LR45_9STRA|nr:hypothetical protein PF011_g5356 [Phytophthora fragariae]